MVKFEIKLNGYPPPPSPTHVPCGYPYVAFNCFHRYLVLMYCVYYAQIHHDTQQFGSQPSPPNAPFLLLLQVITSPTLAMYEAWVIVSSPYHQGQVTILKMNSQFLP